MPLDFSRYDTRHYRIHRVEEGYAQWAPCYDATNDGAIDLDALAALPAVDWAAAPCALDLACGTGRVGAWLRGRGVATVDGVDLTAEMLEHARRGGHYRTLVHGDVVASGLAAASYPLLTCVLAVGHLSALEPFYGEAARLATEGAVLAVVGYHPHFLLNGVPTHFDPPGGGEPVAIQNHIHLFADHVRAAHAAGWRLRDMVERVVDEAWVARRPSYARHLGRPVSFALHWTRTR